MTDLERFNELVDDIWEMVFGTVRRPEVKFKGMMKEVTKQKPGYKKGDLYTKPKRARDAKGRYKGDDKSTKDVNEAWVGGKAPKRDKGIGYK